MSARGDLANKLSTLVKMDKIPPPVREYRFFPFRRWRFDLAWPEHMIAVEVNGGGFSGGRHNTGIGAARDAEKLSAAACEGWRVLIFTTLDLRAHPAYCLRVIRRALGMPGGETEFPVRIKQRSKRKPA